jgi:signal transduction histidine kinase
VDAKGLIGPGRWSRWPRSDLALVAIVATACLLDVWLPLPFVTREPHRGVLTVVFLASSLAMLWRRQAPLAVLGFMFTVSSLMYLAIGAPEALGTFLPELVAVYSLGRYSDARNLVLAASIVLLGTAIHELKDPQFKLSGPAIFFWAMLPAAWLIGHALRQREQAVKVLSQRAEALQHERDVQARAAAVAERARIARELHDVVGHGVSVVVLQLVAALEMLDKDEAAGARQRLVATERSARETLAEMRRLLGLLGEDHDESLAPQPRLSELGQLVAQTRDAGMPVELSVEGAPLELPAGVELAVYRVTQEALTNVIKHAQPARANVRLKYAPHDVTVEIADDGRVTPPSLNGGRGLAGIRERVALYGGELTVGPRSAGGFAVRARFPIGEP